MVKKFILFVLIFISINIIAITALTFYLSHKVAKQGFENWQTESNLLFLKNNQHYNLLFMGISHARNLSRHQNHQRVEKILNKSICNIAQGWDDDGMNVQYLYLNYFYDTGNKADTVVFFASPILFYSDYLDNNPLAYASEPINLKFFWLNVIKGGDDKWQQLFYYVRNKFSPYWLNMTPNTDTIKTDALSKMDTAAVNAGLKDAYRDGMTQMIFEKKCNDLKKIVELAEAHHSRVIFILPPALFGTWPGTDKVIDYLKQLQPVYGTTYYDFSNSVTDPSMYYDHHHLNTKGVVYFTQNYLKPVLGK